MEVRNAERCGGVIIALAVSLVSRRKRTARRHRRNLQTGHHPPPGRRISTAPSGLPKVSCTRGPIRRWLSPTSEPPTRAWPLPGRHRPVSPRPEAPARQRARRTEPGPRLLQDRPDRKIAAATLEKVHRAAPAELQPILLLADCWLAMGENKKVIELLTPLAEQRPDDLAIAYMLGTALVARQPTRAAKSSSIASCATATPPKPGYCSAPPSSTRGDYPAALADLTKAVELNPNLPDVYSYYGQALLRTGDPESATEAFRKALAANPIRLHVQPAAGGSSQGGRQDSTRRSPAFAARYRCGPTISARATSSHASPCAKARSKTPAANSNLSPRKSPAFTEAHVTLATVYYRLKRKEDGDRERAIVQKLNAETQAKQQQGVNVK